MEGALFAEQSSHALIPPTSVYVYLESASESESEYLLELDSELDPLEPASGELLDEPASDELLDELFALSPLVTWPSRPPPPPPPLPP